MNKVLILIFIFCFSLLISSTKDYNTERTVQKDSVPQKIINQDILDKWNKEDSNIDNDEYHTAVNELKKQFDDERKLLNNNYKKRIEPIKNDHNNSIKKLKDKFNQQRKKLRKKYGVKKNKNSDKTKPVKHINSDIKPKPLRKDFKPAEVKKPQSAGAIINKKPVSGINVDKDSKKKDETKK